jgi:hypothetical protein
VIGSTHIIRIRKERHDGGSPPRKPDAALPSLRPISSAGFHQTAPAHLAAAGAKTVLRLDAFDRGQATNALSTETRSLDDVASPIRCAQRCDDVRVDIQMMIGSNELNKKRTKYRSNELNEILSR